MTKELKVYMVIGTTGEYSDRETWPVRAYLSEENAKRHRNAASQWAAEFFRTSYKRTSYKGAGRDAALQTCPHDSNLQMQYTGTDYEIWEAPLGDAPLPPEPPLTLRKITLDKGS